MFCLKQCGEPRLDVLTMLGGIRFIVRAEMVPTRLDDVFEALFARRWLA